MEAAGPGGAFRISSTSWPGVVFAGWVRHRAGESVCWWLGTVGASGGWPGGPWLYRVVLWSGLAAVLAGCRAAAAGGSGPPAPPGPASPQPPVPGPPGWDAARPCPAPVTSRACS